MTATAWTGLGLAAQGCFFMRFFVQWIASGTTGAQRHPRLVLVLSLIGASGLLVYAIHARDPVFIVGQSTGFFIYFRNLAMVRKAPVEAA